MTDPAPAPVLDETADPAPAAASVLDEADADVQLGDTVLYRLIDQDVERLTRPAHLGVRPSHLPGGADRGALAPALVTYIFSPDVVSLRVFIDGQEGPDGPLWAASRSRGTEPGQWRTRR